MIKEDDTDWDYDHFDEDYEEKMEEFYKDIIEVQTRGFITKESKRIHLVENLIEDRSLNVVYGARGDGKSLLLVDLIVHLNNGTRWANKTTLFCDSVYLIFEDPEHIYQRYELTRQVKFKDYELETYPVIFKNPQNIFTPYFETFLKRQRIINLRDETEEYLKNKPQVLVIDTLSYVAAEIGDENNHSTMAPIIKRLRRFISMGWTVFLVTHSGKDSSKGVRGHSSLDGAADNIFHIKKMEKGS